MMSTMTESNSANADGDQDLASAICKSWMAKNVDFSSDEEVTSALKDKWDQVVGPLLATSSNSNTGQGSTGWWNRIVDLHSDPDRAYHTLSHLHEMIGYLDILFGSSHDPAMLLSVFFHDAIYNAKSGTNEEDSAKLLQEFFGDTKVHREGLEKRIVGYILATKTHKLPEEDVDDPNLALFLDIDMAVLGKVQPAYLHYAGLIRKEYEFVHRDAYCQKRADILEKFLEESSIFASAIFRNAMEQQARNNLQEEINLLRTGIIPGTP
jgi:predicted metal-dependent HD superfamily phosphohydrolase